MKTKRRIKMASLKNLVSEIKDPNDYDGVLFVCTKGNHIANLGFTGSLPSGVDQREFVFRKLMEALYTVSFSERNNGEQTTKH